MTTFRFFQCALCVAAIAAAGCRSRPVSPLPSYPLTDTATTLAQYREHASAVKTVQAQATIELTDAKKQTVHLDAVLLLQPPDRVRLRAWKFGTAVFDLTVRGDKAYVYTPRDEARPAMPAARQFILQWLPLLQGNVATSQSEMTASSDAVTVRTPSGDGTIECVIDRATLTASAYRLIDSAGRNRFELSLKDYQPFPGNTVWPMSITATSEQGIIAVHCSDVALNEELPPAAFEPPARADVLP